MNNSTKNLFHTSTKTIAILILIQAIVVGAFVLAKPKDEKINSPQIQEPEVEISKEIIEIEFPSKEDTQTDSDTNPTTKQEDNKEIQAEPQEDSTKATLDLELENISNIQKVEYSQDGTQILILASGDLETSAQKQNNLIQKIAPPAHAKNETTNLYITDTNGKIITSQKDTQIKDAKFSQNNKILYYKASSPQGVYQYDPDTSTETIVEYSYEQESLENIVFVNQEKYFFNQPKTGNFGVATTKSTDKTIIETKQLQTSSNFVESSAFSNLTISKDHKYIALLDKSKQQNDKAILKIYPTTATSASDIYLEQEITLIARTITTGENLISWSEDSRYILAGDSAVLIDIQTKKTVFEKNNTRGLAQISKDNKHIYQYDYETANVIVIDLKDKSEKTINYKVSQASWLGQDHILMSIGKGLYEYKVSENTIKKVNTTATDFEIAASNPTKVTTLVKSAQKLVQIQGPN